MVRLLSIEGQAVEQNVSLNRNRLESRKNLCTMASLTDVSGIPKSIEEDSESSAPALASSAVSRNITMCPGTQISMTQKRPEKRTKQRRHSLMILELFTMFDKDFMAARLSVKIENR